MRTNEPEAYSDHVKLTASRLITRKNITGDLDVKGGGKLSKPPVAGAWDADDRYVVVVPDKAALPRG
jgi:hypothetical protein